MEPVPYPINHEMFRRGGKPQDTDFSSIDFSSITFEPEGNGRRSNERSKTNLLRPDADFDGQHASFSVSTEIISFAGDGNAEGDDDETLLMPSASTVHSGTVVTDKALANRRAGRKSGAPHVDPGRQQQITSSVLRLLNSVFVSHNNEDSHNGQSESESEAPTEHARSEVMKEVPRIGSEKPEGDPLRTGRSKSKSPSRYSPPRTSPNRPMTKEITRDRARSSHDRQHAVTSSDVNKRTIERSEKGKKRAEQWQSRRPHSWGECTDESERGNASVGRKNDKLVSNPHNRRASSCHRRRDDDRHRERRRSTRGPDHDLRDDRQKHGHKTRRRSVSPQKKSSSHDRSLRTTPSSRNTSPKKSSSDRSRPRHGSSDRHSPIKSSSEKTRRRPTTSTPDLSSQSPRKPSIESSAHGRVSSPRKPSKNSRSRERSSSPRKHSRDQRGSGDGHRSPRKQSKEIRRKERSPSAARQGRDSRGKSASRRNRDEQPCKSPRKPSRTSSDKQHDQRKPRRDGVKRSASSPVRGSGDRVSKGEMPESLLLHPIDQSPKGETRVLRGSSHEARHSSASRQRPSTISREKGRTTSLAGSSLHSSRSQLASSSHSHRSSRSAHLAEFGTFSHGDPSHDSSRQSSQSSGMHVATSMDTSKSNVPRSAHTSDSSSHQSSRSSLRRPSLTEAGTKNFDCQDTSDHSSARTGRGSEQKSGSLKSPATKGGWSADVHQSLLTMASPSPQSYQTNVPSLCSSLYLSGEGSQHHKQPERHTPSSSLHTRSSRSSKTNKENFSKRSKTRSQANDFSENDSSICSTDQGGGDPASEAVFHFGDLL